MLFRSLVANGRVFDRIMAAEETHDLFDVISEGGYYGMQTFDQSLLQWYLAGAIDLRDALAASTRPHDLRLMIEHHTLADASS